MATLALKSAASARQLPPGPKGRFLIGNMLELVRDWIGLFTRSAREYGDVVFFRFFNSPVCLLVHPRDIENVLVTEQANFVKAQDYRALASVLGRGLLTSEGDYWRRQRKLIQPAFHHANIVSYGNVMVASTERMLESWREGEPRIVNEDMSRLTLDVVAKALLGADVSSEANKVGDAMQELMEEVISHATLALLLPETLPLPRTFRLRRAVRRLDKIIFEIIRDRRSATGASTDLLGMLLQAQGEDGIGMTDAQLRDEVMTLFLAGHETTALALSWAWYLLALHPEVEKKLLDELQKVLGGRLPYPADVPRLRYCEMVVKEVLRLYPPAWGVGRKALREFEVNGFYLPAGTNVFLAQWITQTDPRFFEEPLRFNPDRWQNDPIRQGKVPRFAYFPFGGGPRVCIGASFAMMEATLLLATIAQRFHLELVADHPVEIQATLTMRPKYGIKVIPHRRPTL